MIGLCIAIPGFVAGATIDVLEHGWEVFGLEIPRFSIWSAFVLLVIGCSTYGGWLLASKTSPEKRVGKFIMSTVTMLICQFVLVPLIGFLAVLSISTMF